MRRTLWIAVVLCVCPGLGAQTVGLPPLTELGAGKYEGFTGGLYAEGKNEPWGAHAEALKRVVSTVAPLDAEGKPDAAGKVVFIVLGASVAKQVGDAIEKEVPAMKGVKPALVFVNGAKGGQDLSKIMDDAGRYWASVDKELAAKGVTAKQVQLAWYQTDDLRDTDAAFPQRPQMLRDKLGESLRLMKTKLPSVRICYMSGRHTTAFMPDVGAKSVKHAEPRPYHNGWATKWLIEEQSGAPGSGPVNLKFEGEGAVAPLAAWATYFWTDGDKAREDGYRWTPQDAVADGIHLSETARPRVAKELLTFFATDTYAKAWFMGAAPVAPAASPLAAKPVKNDTEGPAWIVNRKNKIAKLGRLVGEQAKVRAVVTDKSGKAVLEVEDVMSKHTDLGALLPPGSYKAQFFDAAGKPITLTQEVGESFQLKG